MLDRMEAKPPYLFSFASDMKEKKGYFNGLLTRFAGLPYLGSKTVVAALVALSWNYPLNRLFVFSKHHGDDDRHGSGR